MASQKLFEIALKVLGVLSVVWGIGAASSVVTYWGAFSNGINAAASEAWYIVYARAFVLPLVEIVVGVLLLAKAGVLAAKLMPDTGEIQLILGDNQSAYTLALRILGTYLLVQAIGQIGPIVVGIIGQRMYRQPFFPSYWEHISSFLIRLVIGLYLLFGAKRFVGFVMKGSMRE